MQTTKVSAAPAAMPGAASGTVTSRRTRTGPRPSDRATSSSNGSSWYRGQA